MISTNRHLPIEHPLDLHDETSGIGNLKARERRQRVRDNHHWFQGLCDGFFWGVVFVVFLVALVWIFTR